MKKIIKLTILSKLAIIFITTLLVAIGSTSLLWSQTVRAILQKEITLKQNQLGTRASEKIEGFLDAKRRALIIHSQSVGFLTQDTNLQKLDLTIFLSQDQDIQQLSVINPQGMEILKINRDLSTFSDTKDLYDRSGSPSFLANTFRYTKEYIGEVQFSASGDPYLLMSIPIRIPLSNQRLTELSTQGSPIISASNEFVSGVFEAQISLNNLFAEITDLGLDHDTSVFIVDKEGRIIAHADKNFVSPDVVSNKFPPVKQHVEKIAEGPLATSQKSTVFEYPDENNTKVLGSYSSVKETGWAIVAQQAISKAYADLNQVSNFAVLLLLISIIISIPFTYFLSKKITNPVLALTKGANKISEGNLEYQIQVKTHDELEDLALAFNNMTQKLKDSIGEIESERNKLQVVIYGIEDAVLAINKNHQITLINKAAQKLIELPETQVINKNLSEVFRLFDKEHEIPPSIYCSQNSYVSEGIIFEKKKLEMKTAEDKKKYINLISGKIKESMHSEVDYILTIHDVTAEQKLEEMKLDFVSMAAHELRTPLTSIVGYSTMVIEGAKQMLTQEYLNLLERINTNGKRLSNLVDNLLNVSRIERNEFKLQYKPLDLSEVAIFTIEEMKQLALSKNQKLSYTTPKISNAIIFGDRFKISEVFTNLLENAINYTQVDGVIEVAIEEKSTSYLTIITDNGEGIPKAVQPNLFTKFFRISHGLEQNARGVGLGLYITKSIITLHKGTIWIESELGKGTKVFFEIPKISHQDQKTPSLDTSTSGIIHNENVI